MKFDHSFFENEVRSGFYVPTLIKKCWSAELEVLEVIDRVCKKQNLRYFAGYGTLLGAVRHGGFIPWDDDIDLFMLRADYEKLFTVLDNELPEGYCICNVGVNENFAHGHTTIWNTVGRNIRPDQYEAYHGFIFPAGLDIFPLDYIPRSEEEQIRMKGFLMMLDTIRLNYDDLSESDRKILIRDLADNHGVKLSENESVKRQLADLAQKVTSMYGPEESDNLAFVTFWEKKRPNEVMPKNAFDKTIYLKFENMEIPAPYDYDGVLRGLYGDYSLCKRVGGGHGYPYFLSYRNGFKKNVAELMFYSLNEYTGFPKDERKEELKADRTRTLFVVSRESEYRTVRSVISCAIEDENQDIYITMVPYYRVNGMEKFGISPLPEAQYDIEGFPDEIPITDYSSFDENMYFDRIVVTNPYDYWNDAIMLPNSWMCLNLRKCCREMIYIQHFVMDDYSENDGFSGAVSEFYVCTPGVMLSDKVFVQSELMKEAYLRKIKEVYGEEVAEEKKTRIFGVGSPLWDDSESDIFGRRIWDVIVNE